MAFPELTETYVRENSFVKQYLESYNNFVERGMQRIVDEQATIEPQIEELTLKLGKLRIEKPMITEADGSRRTVYPIEARMRDLSYTAPVFLEMTPVIGGSEKRMEEVFIGELPVMVKSNLCYLKGRTKEELIALGEDPMDVGGYFIINGTEKSLMTLEDLAPNRILVSKEKDKGITQAKIFSTRAGFRGRCTVDRSSEGKLGVTMPSYNKSLELVLVLRALGLDKEEKIMEAFPDYAEIKNDILLNLEGEEAKTRKDALEVIGKRAAPGQPVDYQTKRAALLIDRYLLPHIGVDENARLAKAYFLCRMAERSILVAYKKRGAEDKDHYANKRLKIAGKLMEELFRYAFQFLVKDIAYQMERANVRGRKMSMFAIVRPDALTERIKYSMATGNWVGGHTGVSQPLDRYNFISATSFLRRVTSPLAKKHPHYKARDLNGTHFGRLDPNETPEGPNCVASDTQVTLSNESGTTISDYKDIGERLLAFDWEKKELKKADVVRYVKQTAQKAFRITTKETGRTITATADHPFYSESGKVALKELKEGSKLAVLPLIPLRYEASQKQVILQEGGFREQCLHKSDVEYCVEVLKEKKLLPLTSDNPKVLVLARLLGHLFGDGCLSYSEKRFKTNCTIAFTGHEKSLQQITTDLREIGFGTSKITSQHCVSTVSGKQINGITTHCFCYSKPLFMLFKALGAPIGDKTVQETTVPEWIFTQTKLVKKEFLSAYFGSEMTTPTIDERNGKIFLQPSFSLNKKKDLVQNGLEFTEQINDLLSEFQIASSKTVIVEGVKRKNGVETKKIRVTLKSTPENLIKLYGTIGFAYCPERKARGLFATEYIASKQEMISERQEAMKQALILVSNGKNTKEIASSLGVRVHDVRNWLSKNKTGKARVSEKDFPQFREWMAEHALNEEGMVWESIAKIEEVQCNDVRDVTTLQDYHNFFANGFLTGNCGLVKNLAIFCEITTGAEEKTVENQLKKMGVTMRV